MAFQVSPGVQVKEIDLTNVVPAVSTSIGAFVGNFAWGPVQDITTVTSEKDLAEKFGLPKASASVDFFTAAYFLKYGNHLKIIRSIDTTARNATSDDVTTAVTINELNDYQNQVFSGNVSLTLDGVVQLGDTVITVTAASLLDANNQPTVTIGDVVSDLVGIDPGSVITAIDTTAMTITIDLPTLAIIPDANTIDVAVNKGTWIAKYPGSLGNSLAVHMCPVSAGNTAFTGWTYKSYFTAPPSSSDFASNKGGTGDEMHIVVVDEDGAWTGTAGTVLETFGFVSQASDAKTNDGATNYYVDVINNQSSYIWWGNHHASLSQAGSTADTVFIPAAGAVNDSLDGGVDSGALGVTELQDCVDLLRDEENTDINLLICPSLPSGSIDATTVANDFISLAEERKDCVAFISPPTVATVGSLDPVGDIIAFADTLTSSSYAVIDSTALKVYDKYNDQYIWIPASSSVAGLCANTDDVADAWFSPAGFSRGQLLGVTKVALNPTKVMRDELYTSRVNPIVSFPGEGTVLYGDKTAQAKPSAFDRINVRRLFIVLEKAISTAAKYHLFEFNDEFTRAQFRNMVEPFLRDVQGRRGITDFAVICDETNNTGEVIDTNRFVADIYIKPARSINFITLNFIATRTGVEFSEIIGQ